MNKLPLIILLFITSFVIFAQDKPDILKGNLIFKPTTGYGADTAFAYIIKNSNTAGQSGFIGILGTDTMYLTISNDSIRLFGTKPFAGGGTTDTTSLSNRINAIIGNATSLTNKYSLGTLDSISLPTATYGLVSVMLGDNQYTCTFSYKSDGTFRYADSYGGVNFTDTGATLRIYTIGTQIVMKNGTAGTLNLLIQGIR